MKTCKSQSGFTMIELIIVIAVLGIIIAIAMPQLIGFHQQANRVELEQLGRDIYGAMSLVYAQQESYEHDDLSDVAKKDQAIISFELAEIQISDKIGVEFKEVDKEDYQIKLIHKKLADDEVIIRAEGVSASWKESSE